MGRKSCFICCKQCFPRGLNTMPTKTASSSGEREFVDDQLPVVFLLRKLLEIPEDTCCKLLKHFGNPNLWIEYCDSCSVLVEKCQTILHQIASLEKHYDELRKDIKNTIIKSQKHFDYEFQCETIVRSQIILKDVDYFIEATSFDKEKEASSHANPKRVDKIKITQGQGSVVYPDEENYSQINCGLISSNLDSYGNDSFSQCAGETEMGNHFTEEDFDKNSEILGGEVINAKMEYDDQEIDDDNIDIKPFELHVEEGASSTQLTLFTRYDETLTNQSDATIQEPLIQPKSLQYSTSRKNFAGSRKRQSHTAVRNKGKRKPFKCDFCGTCFIFKSLLTRHIVIHSSVKEHQCDICGDRFSRKDKVMHHKRITHTTDMEYPYTCIMCGKSSTELESLKAHYWEHTEGKTMCFNCLTCGKSFTRLHHLKKHHVKHLEEKS